LRRLLHDGQETSGASSSENENATGARLPLALGLELGLTMNY
jgi:hypothetical protein